MLSFCVLSLSFRCLPERRGPTRWILKGHGSALFNKWLVSRPDQWPCQHHILKHISVFTWAHRRERTALWFGYGNVSVPGVFRLQKWICCLCWCVCCIYEKERWFPGPVESQLLSRTSLSLCWMWWRELYLSVSHALALELTVKYVLHDGWLLCLYASPLVELLLEFFTVFCCSSHSYICRFSSGNFTPALFLTYSL